MSLTAEQAREAVEYDPETGAFTWKHCRGTARVGAPAGIFDERGYRRIKINRRSYLAHRLAWFLVHGQWPTGEVDHIDGNPSNNRIANLRDVTANANRQNQRRAHCDSKSGLLGASWHKLTQRWRGTITAGGRSVHLGFFDSAQESHAAYLDAKRRLHEGNTL